MEKLARFPTSHDLGLAPCLPLMTSAAALVLWAHSAPGTLRHAQLAPLGVHPVSSATMCRDQKLAVVKYVDVL